MTWAQWLSGLREDALPYSRQLAECPHEAIFWECRPDRTRPFDHQLIDSPALARVRADPGAFKGHLGRPANTFRNLGGSSALVAPSATGDYPHLLAFLRSAPDAQIQALWTAVADAVDAWEGPLYLSTSGLGVYWLHVRLDPRPKYFTHRPYRATPPEIAALRHPVDELRPPRR